MRWVVALVLVAACGRGADVIVVGSKNFTEQRILGERSEERRVGKECRSRWSPYH